MEKAMWPVLGVVILVAAVRSRRSRSALQVGRAALAMLFLAFGAAVNAIYLVTGVDYADFADASPIPFVHDTWRSLVAPHQVAWIGLLIVFETAVGILVLLGGRSTQLALVALIGFHVALLAFSWWLWAWSVPMLVALGLLLRAERHPAPLLEPRVQPLASSAR